MQFEKFKRFFLQTLIGCLIAAALLSVVTVLAGQFNDTFAKALLTLLVIAVHSLVSFGFILNHEKQPNVENLELFTNATFMIIVLSFITSVLGIWGIIGGELVGKLYMTYFVLLFAILHGEVLAKTLGEESYIDNIVYGNFVFMFFVVLMLLPVIFFGSEQFDSIYYRLLAAFGIIDATLTLLTVILHKLYLQKHPKVNDAVFAIQPGGPNTPASTQAQPQAHQPKRGMNILVIILIAFLALQFIGSIMVAFIGALYR